MASTTAAADRVPLPRLIQFATGAFAVSGVTFALGIHAPRYFAAHVGIGLAAVGLAFTMVRLLDLFVDPVLGLLMDRTKTRLGRFRPWLLAGAPILMLSAYMLFMAQPGNTIIYLIGWLLVLYLATSMIGLSQAAWAGVLSPDYSERARVFGAIGTAGYTGSATVMLVPSALALPWVISLLGPANDVSSVHAMGWVMISLVPVCVLLTAFTREPIRAALTHERPTLQEYVKVLWRPAVRRLVLADFASALGPGTLSPIFIFYWHDARLAPFPITNLMLVFFMFGSLCGATAWAWVATRIGKHRAAIASAIGFALGQAAVVSLPRGAPAPALFAGMFAVGFLIAAASTMTRAIMADVADEVRLDTGRERSGLLYSCLSTTQKIGGAISVSISFWIIAALGYNPAPGAHNTPEHLRGLELTYALAPITFILIGALFLVRFPLNAKRHAEILAALAARGEAETPEPNPVTGVEEGELEVITGA